MVGVHFDTEVELRPDDLANRRDFLYEAVDEIRILRVARRPAAAVVHARLHRGVALGQNAARGFHVLSLAVDADAIARRSAEQLVDGHAERLALYVPHRDVDSRERARQDDV